MAKKREALGGQEDKMGEESGSEKKRQMDRTD